MRRKDIVKSKLPRLAAIRQPATIFEGLGRHNDILARIIRTGRTTGLDVAIVDSRIGERAFAFLAASLFRVLAV